MSKSYSYENFYTQCFQPWERLGTEVFEDTSVGIKHYTRELQHVHKLLTPFHDDEIQEIQDHYGLQFSKDLIDLYKFCGGGYFFDYTFDIQGLNRRHRIPQKSWTTQVSLHVLNSGERPQGALPQHYFFGLLELHGNDQYPIFYDTFTNTVHECIERKKLVYGRSWSSIPEFMTEEFKRIETFYDENGLRRISSPDMRYKG